MKKRIVSLLLCLGSVILAMEPEKSGSVGSLDCMSDLTRDLLRNQQGPSADENTTTLSFLETLGLFDDHLHDTQERLGQIQEALNVLREEHVQAPTGLFKKKFPIYSVDVVAIARHLDPLIAQCETARIPFTITIDRARNILIVTASWEILACVQRTIENLDREVLNENEIQITGNSDTSEYLQSKL
jgi:hypothetical protein